MKNYFSAFINKTVPFENAKLEKNLQKDLSKSLHISRSTVTSKEHNTFLFLGTTNPPKKPLTKEVIESTENRLRLRLNKYYQNNNSKLKKNLKMILNHAVMLQHYKINL